MSSELEKITILINFTCIACKSAHLTAEPDIESQFNKCAKALGIDTTSDAARTAYHEVAQRLHIDQLSPLDDSEESSELVSPETKEAEYWLSQAKENHHPTPHWDCYRKYLEHFEHADDDQLQKLDDLTDSILKKCSNPSRSANPVIRKGLVIGEVQAGKTRTYLGLSNKAIDYGYRLIVILTSSNEALRSQTQKRVDQGVLGFDSSKGANSRPVGIGRIRRKTPDIQAFTSTESDFNTASAKSVSGLIRPSWDNQASAVFVMKKEHTALQSFIDWLGDMSESSIPVLVIDDESDYASINSSKTAESPTAINGLLRQMYHLSPRTSYVAITATPYANVFIDYAVDEDLFPKDFIQTMPTPLAYVGGKRLFGDLENSDVDRRVVHFFDEGELDKWLPLSHGRNFVIENPLDTQVKIGIRTFLLGSAIRELRINRETDSSMLIHMSRFQQVQRQIADQVKGYVNQLLNSITFHRFDDDNTDIKELRRTFEDQYLNSTQSTWDNILQRIAQKAANKQIVPRLVNSSSIDWYASEDEANNRVDNEWSLFIGGNILSRGMTLPGLICSLFYRNVSAADTLQQMARWFGYRPHYEDLERIWLRYDTCLEFQYIVSANEELRMEIEAMEKQGLTPAKFGLKVLKDPENLITITSSPKMRNTTTSDPNRIVGTFSIDGQRVETTLLSSDKAQIQQNLDALEKLVGQIKDSPCTITSTDTVFTNVPGEPIYQFLTDYRAGYGDKYFSNTLLQNARKGAAPHELDSSIASQFAETQRIKNPDGLWNVVFVSKQRDDLASGLKLDFDVPFPWNAKTLSVTEKSEYHRYDLSGSSRRLAGRSDVRKIVEIINPAALQANDLTEKQKNNEATYYQSTKEYFGDTPVLMLYLLGLRKKDDPEFENSDSVPEYTYLPTLQVGVKIVIANSYSTDEESTRGSVTYSYNTVATDINRQNHLNHLASEEADYDDGDD